MLLQSFLLLILLVVVVHHWFIGIWQPEAGVQYMYTHTVNNHTIKYESVSLVVGEAIAYKRVLNLF